MVNATVSKWGSPRQQGRKPGQEGYKDYKAIKNLDFGVIPHPKLGAQVLAMEAG